MVYNILALSFIFAIGAMFGAWLEEAAKANETEDALKEGYEQGYKDGLIAREKKGM